MKPMTTLLPKALMLSLLLGVCTESLSAQHYVHGTNATLQLSTTGVIKLRGASSQFRNHAASTAGIINAGAIEVVGNVNGDAFADGAGSLTSATAIGSNGTTLRVPGLVRYTTTAVQTVQSLWYSDLEMANSGGKNFLGGAVYVSGGYQVDGGTRDYGSSTFYYDGDNQNITTENGNTAAENRYYNLVFIGSGVKTVTSGSIVHVVNDLTLATAPTLSVAGQLRHQGVNAVFNNATTIDGATAVLEFDHSGTVQHAGASATVSVNAGDLVISGSGTTTFEGNVTVGDGAGDAGELSIGASTGTVTMNNSTFTLANTDGFLTASTASVLDIKGAFNNNFIGSTNTVYADNSTVIFSGGAAQVITGTVETNPYGNLVATNATKSINGQVFLAGNFEAYDNNVIVTSGSTSFIHMLDNQATVTYGSGIEVEGQFRRTFGASAVTSNALTFNNEETRVTVTDNPASVDYISLTVNPNTSPVDVSYTGATDVNRRLQFGYSETANDWRAQVRVGYLQGEEPSDAVAKSTLRFREGIAPVGSSEKIATGFALSTNNTATPFRYVELAGWSSAGGSPIALAQVANGAEVFLRGGPTDFNTIAHGRWSNPGTWDEGVEPGATDNAFVNHTVHVGFRRDAIDGLIADGRIREGYATGAKAALASNITINNTTSASLLFGSNSVGQPDEQNDNISWLITGTFTNSNANGVPLNVDAAFQTGLFTSNTLYNGLINAPVSGSGSIWVSSGNFFNNGIFSNGGLFEVGQ